tara:strand:+ start:63 stop:356 length:294 start_codon:yes stop_codon:yes gene_type:complete
MEQLSKKELQSLAKLSHLQLDEKESNALALELSKVLEYFSSLQEIDTKDVKIAGHPLKKVNTYRADKISKSMKTEDVLKNAPLRNKNFFKIKKVLDK